MVTERQTTFGWLVATDVFLGGAGAGLFLISFIIGFFDQFGALARMGAVIGPVLVLLGNFLLFIELGSKRAVYRLLRNPSSWMARGTWFNILFIIFGLAYALPGFWTVWDRTTMPAMFVGVIATIFAILVMLYTGFLFSAAKRIPFWTTSALPLLFFFTSLYTGMAVLLLIAGFYETGLGDALRALVITEIILILLQILVLVVSVGVSSYGGVTSVQSGRQLVKRPLFIAMVIFLGLVIPLGLLGYFGLVLDTFAPSVVAGILILIGGLFLRYSVLREGVRLPLYPL